LLWGEPGRGKQGFFRRLSKVVPWYKDLIFPAADYGTAEQLAEKAGERKENHPSAAKAGFIVLRLRHGSKPCPFKELSFSASCEAVPPENGRRG
jgi:hypothetical protein